MTHKTVIKAVVSQRNRAIRTGNDMPAFITGYKGIIPSAVDEQYSLLVIIKIFRNQLFKP